MSAAGKKGKKGKWRPIDVKAILPDSQPALSKSAQWCDEIDGDDRESIPVRKPVLPTAPRSVRGTDDERVPKDGPYIAYVTNIPFELEENDLAEFFGDLQISNIRLPKSDGKLKGFGYVEFVERSGLIEALRISDTILKGRRIRIDISDNNGRMDRMGRDRMGLGRDRDDDPDRTSGDWRSGPRMDPPGEDRDRGGRRDFGGGGYRDGDRENRDRGGFGAPRETDSREGGWREGMGSGTSERFGDRDRDSYRSREGYGDRDRGYGERRGFGDRDRDGGYDRDRGSRYGEREGYGERSRFSDREGPSRRFDDKEEDRDRDRYPRRDDGPPADSGEPKARPRLQLQPRSRPVENPLPPPAVEKPAPSDPVPAPAPAPAPSVPRASIFGAAKPVDTAAREREIEERLARERERTAAAAPPLPVAPKPTDEPRSKESSEHGDEPRVSKKVEPAPPPKENAWTRRPRIESDEKNGDSSREEAYDHRSESPTRDDRRDDYREDYRDERPEGQRDERRDDREDYQSGRGGYGYNRDRRDYGRDDGQRDSSNGRGGYRESERSGYRESEGGKSGYRDAEGGRASYRDGDANRGYRDEAGRGGSRDYKDNYSRDGDYGRSKDEHSSGTDRYERGDARGRGMGHHRVDRAGGGGSVDGKGRTQSGSAPRPSRREQSDDDQSRMPKYEEKQVPNFAGSNKYAYLHEDDER